MGYLSDEIVRGRSALWKEVKVRLYGRYKSKDARRIKEPVHQGAFRMFTSRTDRTMSLELRQPSRSGFFHEFRFQISVPAFDQEGNIPGTKGIVKGR